MLNIQLLLLCSSLLHSARTLPASLLEATYQQYVIGSLLCDLHQGSHRRVLGVRKHHRRPHTAVLIKALAAHHPSWLPIATMLPIPRP